MPESTEKDVFKGQLTGAIDELNTWLDSDNLKRRIILRRVRGATYVVGVGAVLVSLPFADHSTNPWFSTVLGASIGMAIALVTFCASYFLERSARRQAAVQEKAREDAAAATRIEALRRGEAAKV
jgi:hypothetical protein